jgi:hypothetical protein
LNNRTLEYGTIAYRLDWSAAPPTRVGTLNEKSHVGRRFRQSLGSIPTGDMSLPRHAEPVASPRRLRFVRVQRAGLLARVLALAVLDALSLDTFLVCSLLAATVLRN